MTSAPDDFADASTESEVLIRRAPKYWAFIAAGATLGVIVTLILTLIFPVAGDASVLQLFGYFVLYGLPAGAIIGAVVALLFDRVASRRLHTVMAGKLTVRAQQGEQSPQHSESGNDADKSQR
jgi:hypothetical protein